MCYVMCMSPSSLGNCTIYSTWCIMICLVIPILSLLLFIQSLYSLSKLQIFPFTCRHDVRTCVCTICTCPSRSIDQECRYYMRWPAYGNKSSHPGHPGTSGPERTYIHIRIKLYIDRGTLSAACGGLLCAPPVNGK